VTDANKQRIAILGGTGALGTGLAQRWAAAGYPLIIGSRDPNKAVEAVAALHSMLAGGAAAVQAMSNGDAAAAAELVVLTVPYAHQRATLESVRSQLDGKILVAVTVPLMPPKVGTVQLPAAGSAAVEAQQQLGDGVRVVSALQNVAAAHLQSGHAVDCDVLVCANSKEARQQVIDLIAAAGMRAFHAGPLANSAAAEALTSVLININRAFACHAGIRITGLPDAT
jgi:8-hydroxy-5-deazaflavin:NADPH oxidoreductase